MKVWEEEWTITDVMDMPWDDSEYCMRTRLASAAPDMARVLLLIDGRLDLRPEFHEAIDAALKKAGVR